MKPSVPISTAALRPVSNRPALSQSHRSATTPSHLLTPILPGLKINIRAADGRTVVASVRAITEQDLVLVVPNPDCPAPGDLVSMTISEDDTILMDEAAGVVHWEHTNSNQPTERTIAVFCVKRLDDVLQHRIRDDRREEIRFPASFPVALQSNDKPLDAEVQDYSLHGVAILTREPLDLNRQYTITGRDNDSIGEVTAEVQWQTRQADGFLTGCALPAQHGVILAEMKRQYQLQNGSPTDSWRADAGLTAAHTGGRYKTSPVHSTHRQALDPVIRHMVPMLSAILITLSIQWTSPLKTVLLLSGLVGVIASIGLNMVSDYRTCLTSEAAAALEDPAAPV